METMIIGIAGGTGSGKTTLTLRLKEHFGEDVSILYHDNYYKQHDDMPYEERFGEDVSVLFHDNYYKSHSEMPYEERAKLNYDHPDAFDTELLIADLQALRRGEAVHSPTYDYTVHNRAAETVEVRPARVILVEGILIFVDPALRELMDIKLFVDTDADVRILRRIMRDVKKRGRSLDSVVQQYLTTVKPMHEQFVEPSKRYADLIVPEGGKNAVALDMIIQRVKSHMEQE